MRDYSIDHDSANELIEIRAAGEFRLQATRALWEDVARACNRTGVHTLLLDLRGRSYPFAPEDAFEVFRTVVPPSIQGKLVAIILPPEAGAFGVAALVTGDVTWNHVRFFHDERSARLWLALNKASEEWKAA